MGASMKAVIGVVALATASSASAGFIGNYGDWSKLSASQKSAYAMGVADGTMLADSDPYTTARVMGIDDCLGVISIDTSMTVKLIEDGYSRDPANWSRSPLAVYIDGMTRVCKAQINARRVASGLKPIP